MSITQNRSEKDREGIAEDPSLSADNKADAYLSNAYDIEVGVNAVDGDRAPDTIYDVIPEGVNPALVREERVHRGLKQRHIQMIALAGAIGTGLFLGSGKSIRRAGPVGTLIGYGIVGTLVMSVMGCLAELSALAPISGAFVRQSEFFFDPALAFAIGWCCFYGSVVSVPAEWSAVAVIMTYWTDLSPAIWIAICIFITFMTNLFLIRIYGEVELICAMLKILLILGLILFGLIYDLGGIPGTDRIGFAYWKDPGVFGEGYYYTGTAGGRFCGFWLTLINAVYAFSGVESLAIAAAETKNPRRNVPKAAKHVFIRVFVFYLVTLFIVGLIVPYNDKNLLQSTGTAASSPFVIAAQRAGVKVLPSIINAVIITSAWSSGNHGMLVGSRSLYALALDGKAPKIFTRVSRYGIPYLAVLFQGAFQLLAFMSLNNGAATVFNWMTNINSSSTLCIWIVIGFINLRVRQGMKAQGIAQTKLPWSAPLQPYISHYTIWGSFIVLITGGFYSFLPGNWDVSDFFSSYFSVIFMIVFYFGYKLVKKTKIVPLTEIPVGQFIAIADANPEEEAKPAKGPWSWFAKFWWD
ncbi:uncharacterized protein I206_106371 [Kwoniella pini CBS 10737]|uniref:Amino acid permease/ SLC12A domain-containing protein n=1 Tax=Kwoniella pini CBS 10737 TaxID=1296096 RepID=A0A1B9HU40_9TREE|nr:uncharacterized protein I206_07174 [Kwoniella pini CBS 10737]OCF46787.1 hypothetical protein I206_07174 [Kwoniella pini CBS 10737]